VVLVEILHLPCKFCIVEFYLSMVSQIHTDSGDSLVKLAQVIA